MLAAVLRWFWPYWRQVRKGMTVVFGLTVLGIATRALYPVVFMFIIDAMMGVGEQGAYNPLRRWIAGLTQDLAPAGSAARTWILVLLGIGFLRSLTQAFLPSTRARGNMVIGRAIRMKMLDGILRKRHGFFQRYQPGDLVTRLTDDIDQSDKLSWYSCSGVFRPIEAGLTLVFSLAIMFSIHWKLTLASTLPLPFIVWVLHKTEGLQHRRYAERQKTTSRTVEVLESAFSGARVVVGFNMEDAQERILDEALAAREKAEKRVVTVRASLESVFAVMNQVGLVIVLFLGGWFVLEDPSFTPGAFYAFVAYLSGLAMPLWTISYFLVSTNLAHASMQRLDEIEREEERRPGNERLTDPRPSLHVEDLSFSYRGESPVNVLSDVSFSVRPGETVALVGPVGCGKTTLLECAVGLLEPEAGQVRLGVEQPLLRLTDAERARAVGYAPQEPLLFAGRVDMNVTLDREGISERQVRRAMEAACLDGEVPADKEVAQAGRGLSGGQKARVALARALAGEPHVLVLDDVTSALDASTEERFWAQVREQLPDAGILVSTHREVTAQRADRVLWLEDGGIRHEGRHDELLAAHADYKRLFAVE